MQNENHLLQLKMHKKHEIIHYIHTNYVNPETNKPYTLSEIEITLNQSKIDIDYLQSTEAQFTKQIDKFIKLKPLKRTKYVKGKILLPIKEWAKKEVKNNIAPIKTSLQTTQFGVIIDVKLLRDEYNQQFFNLGQLTNNNYTFVIL